MQDISERHPQSSQDRVRQSKGVQDVAVVVVNYNGLRTVLDTIRSMLDQQGVRPHVIVVDDGSSDGSPDAIAREFPDIKIHREPRNTRQVNRLRNIGLTSAKTDRVFVTDNDVTFDSRCLDEMLRAMDANENVAMCTPRIMSSVDRSIVYIGGAKVHYIGATIEPNRDKLDDGRTEPAFGVGGGIALFDRDKVARVGGFDDAYRLAWGDDVELHQRLLLAGYKSLYVPTAVCVHEYKPFDKSRHYRAKGQLHNRWRFLLTHHSLQTLLLMTPALLLYEVVQGGFFAVKGIPHLYLLGTLEALRDLPATLRRRRVVQALRVVPDRELLFAGDIYVRSEHGAGGAGMVRVFRAVNGLLSAYWRLILPALQRPRDSADRAHSMVNE